MSAAIYSEYRIIQVMGTGTGKDRGPINPNTVAVAQFQQGFIPVGGVTCEGAGTPTCYQAFAKPTGTARGGGRRKNHGNAGKGTRRRR
jgi:hypothetical protein